MLNSKPKFEKLTAVKAAYWLSEAWGETIKPNDSFVEYPTIE